MKSQKIIAFFLLMLPTIVVINSCHKKTKFTISGTFYDHCGKSVSASTIDIRQRSTVYQDKSGGSIGTVKTDGNGNYSFVYKQLDNSGLISIFDGTDASANLIMEGIPVNQNVDLKMYRYLNVNITFTIDYDSTADTLYTRKDTLILGAVNKFAGPFHRGQVLNSVGQIEDVNFYGYQNKNYTLCWGIGWNDYYRSTNSLGHYHQYHVVNYNMNADCGAATNVIVKIQTKK